LINCPAAEIGGHCPALAAGVGLLVRSGKILERVAGDSSDVLAGAPIPERNQGSAIDISGSSRSVLLAPSIQPRFDDRSIEIGQGPEPGLDWHTQPRSQVHGREAGQAQECPYVPARLTASGEFREWRTRGLGAALTGRGRNRMPNKLGFPLVEGPIYAADGHFRPEYRPVDLGG
jgi:hypothetical protein